MKIDKYKNVKARKRKKRRYNVYNKNDIWLSVGFCAALILLWLFNLLPALQPIRDSLAFAITGRIIISGIIVYFTWFHSSKPNLLGSIISTTVAVLFWLPLLPISNQVLMIIRIAITLAVFVYMAIMFFVMKKWFGVIIAEALLLVLLLALDMLDYEYLNNPNSFHFWLIPLILSVIMTILSIILILLDKIDMRRSDLIALPFIVFIAIFFISMSVICNLNYALDTNEPIEKSAIILDVDIDAGARQATTYEFYLLIDEKKIKLNVSQSEFYKYEIGDSYPVKIYKGAFNEPFYISGNR